MAPKTVAFNLNGSYLPQRRKVRKEIQILMMKSSQTIQVKDSSQITA
jgi:hypothetical protein